MPNDAAHWRRQMRTDWDARAAKDAEHFIYTRDSNDALDFIASGKANYDQLVRPYLPILLSGRPSRDCRVLEIGCGIGRITECFARDFSHVDAIDISPVMIAMARERLTSYPNITWHVGTGSDLEPIPSASIDHVFSYIVFQHIPSRDIIDNLFRETARVLKPGGTMKIQLNGDQSPDYVSHQPDTWLGETYSVDQVSDVLARCGLSAISMEGAGTQYFTVTACKGPAPEISWVLPGEPWSSQYLLEGFGAPVENSWRPISASARVRVPGSGTRLYLGLYFWPESCQHTVTLAGKPFNVTSSGDHCFETAGASGDIEIRIDPLPSRLPAFRVIGLC